MRNIFLEKSYTDMLGKPVPDPFIKNQNWAYIWTKGLKFYTVCFYCMSKQRISKTRWNYGADHLLLPHINLKKNKLRSGTSLPTSFSTQFLKKSLPYVLFWLPFPLEILGNIWIVIICLPVCDGINFEINLSFFIKAFSYMTNKSGQTFKYLRNENSF